MHRLTGGRRLARKRASSDPTAAKLANKSGGLDAELVGTGQGEHARAAHTPDTEPGERVLQTHYARSGANRLRWRYRLTSAKLVQSR
jgi:hypothetical protein